MRGQFLLITAVAFALAGCRLVGGTPSTDPGSQAIGTASATHSAQPTATKTLHVSPLTEQEIADEQLALQPLPSGAPVGLSQDEAVAIALPELSSIGGTDELLYAEHGLGVGELGNPPEPVWVIIVAADRTPQPGGPQCDPGECTPATLVTELAGAVVSDNSGTVDRLFSRGHVQVNTPKN